MQSFGELIRSLSWQSGELARVATRLERAHRDGVIRALLRAAISRTTEFPIVAKASYRHPNGFEKYMLFHDPDSDLLVRLHRWPVTAKEEIGAANYHCHTRDFVSLVLGGALTDNLFDESLEVDAPVSAEKYKVYERPAGGRYRYEKLGQVGLEWVSRETVVAGRAYSRSFDQIHRSGLESEVDALTLFIQGPLQRSFSYSYSVRGFTDEYDAAELGFSEEEYRNGLEVIDAAMLS